MCHSGITAVDAHFEKTFGSGMDVRAGGEPDLQRIRAKALSRLPWLGVRRFSKAAGLAGSGRVDLRAAHVSFFVQDLRPALHQLDLWGGELDHRLSALGPAFVGGGAAVDAHPGAVDRAAGESG